MFNQVLVGIDEQTRGRDAIALARRLAGIDSEITFAYVYPPVVSAKSVAGDSPTDAGAAIELLRASLPSGGCRSIPALLPRSASATAYGRSPIRSMPICW